jgi:FAD/FMN-containing dehydrogenase
MPTRPARPAGHVALTHFGWDDLGHDWSKVADPAGPARPPFAVYLPRSTADVARAVRESALLGRPVVVRGAAHSSNGLVTAPGGALLLTAGLDRVLDVDAERGEVTVQPGAPVTAVDAALAAHGRGLEVVPDHPDITVGGFAAVGGFSPASLHAGLFVDTVTGIEYVDPAGEVRRASRDGDEAALLHVLGGLGRTGILTQIRLRTVPAEKDRAVVRNRRRRLADPDSFVRAAQQLFAAPGAARFARASWLDLPKGRPGGNGIRFGTLSAFEPVTSGQRLARARAALAYGALRTAGRLSTTLPGAAGVAAKYAGTAGLMLAPGYARHRDVERFSDGVIDWTVGEPSRLLVAIAPIDVLPQVFSEIYESARYARRRDAGLTFVTVHLKAARSGYLSGGDPGRVFVEVLLVVGVDPARLHSAALDRLVRRIDDVCLRHGAFRYQHTLTSPRSAAEARRLDPHGRYERDQQPQLGLADGVPA